MQDIVITAAKRTPVGSFLGAFAATPAHELGRIAIEAALAQAGVAGADVSEVILGQVLTAAQGQNPARQASMAAGVPKEIPAWGVNQVCGSGLRAVALAAQAIATGDSTIVVAGGQESMSMSAHAQLLRAGQKMGDLSLIDTMVKDGMSRAEAERRGSPILARIASWASAGVDPSIMGIGPVPATRRALQKAGWSIADLDLIEANEAFAAQALSVGKELEWDADRVNVNGGAIAIGHPIGASGARILTTLLYEMAKRDVTKGLATLCIGGGMGIALCVER